MASGSLSRLPGLKWRRFSFRTAASKERQAPIAGPSFPVSVTADALVRVGFWPRSGATASYIQVTGNSDTLPVDTVVKIYTAVVRGAGGGGGGGGVGPEGPAGADGMDGMDGADGAAGPAGAAGADGDDGAEIFFDASDPVATDGSDGDTWINTTDGTIWTKAGGA